MKSLKQSAWVFVLLTLGGIASANDGQFIFVSGNVVVERGDTELYPRRGDRVQEGDTIRTGAGGRAHLRMADNTLLSFKPGTTFQIEEFNYPGARAVAPAAAQNTSLSRPRDRDQAGSRAARSFFRLVSGGFRAITGAIGRSDSAAFRVQTPVATIGIRGTTFRAACVDGCQRGLVFGVTEGSIVATSDGGSLVLFNDEFGFVQSRDSAPRQLDAEPPSLRDDAPQPRSKRDGSAAEERADAQKPAEQRQAQAQRPAAQRAAANRRAQSASTAAAQSSSSMSSTDSSRESSATAQQSGDAGSTESDSPVISETANPAGSGFRSVALGFGGTVAPPGLPSLNLNNTPSSLVRVTANNALLGTSVPLESADEGAQAQTRATIGPNPDDPFSAVDTGFASNLRLAWGRWAGGMIRVSQGERNFDSDTNAAAAHWVVSGVNEGAVALPSSGSREYAVLGSTSPTNAAGSVGQLGSASLRANFSTSTVQASVDLSIEEASWRAEGGGQIGGSAGNANLFGGSFSQVSVDGRSGGSGAFSGFFTSQAAGAGMVYGLTGPQGGDVAGSVVFRDVTPPPDPDPQDSGAVGGSGGTR